LRLLQPIKQELPDGHDEQMELEMADRDPGTATS